MQFDGIWPKSEDISSVRASRREKLAFNHIISLAMRVTRISRLMRSLRRGENMREALEKVARELERMKYYDRKTRKIILIP